MKIVADDKIPFLKGALEQYAEVLYYPADKITNETVKNADALIIRTRTKCNADLLKGSNVKFIATATIGFDHIDTKYCYVNGINWVNAPGCNSISVMQYIASALAFISHKHNFNYANKTMGIVGCGNVGSKISTLASSLGMKVLLNDPPRERKEGKSGFVSLEEIKKKADIITFHVPLHKNGRDKTLHLVDEEFLDKIKPNTIIINSSRGEIIETAAFKKALNKNLIQAAVLDVWENEPKIDVELLKLVDLGTPHIAGYSIDGKAMATIMSVHSISRFFKLGLDNWKPDCIPSLPNDCINIDCTNLSVQQVLNKAILSTYNIKKDSELFKKHPDKFEKQREDYPIRKEFGFFKVCLKNDKKNIIQLLKNMGFKCCT